MAPAATLQQSSGHPTTFEPLTSSQHVVAPTKHDVQATLNYYFDDGKEPAPSYVGRPETYVRQPQPLAVTVHDIRGQEADYTLDSHGFQIYPHTSKEIKFDDDEKIKAEYWAETEQLLKDATGATRVFIFDHTIRRQTEDTRAPAGILRGPVNRVHIDQSYKAARSRVPFHLPDEAEALLKTRHQIINVWRPIKQIFKDPLGVCDSNTVPESDLVTVPLIYPNRKGETLAVRPNSAHKWYYLHGQTPEEPLLIRCYDSKLDGRARRVPHTAFSNPEYVDSPSRESIEVRALVFHENEPAE